MSRSPAWIDGALYPDVDPPDRLQGLDERVDFLARLCAAWSFGVLPGGRPWQKSCAPNGAKPRMRANC